MSEKDENKKGKEEKPSGQKFFDNIFLLLVLSTLISLLVYNGWGMLEILNLK